MTRTEDIWMTLDTVGNILERSKRFCCLSILSFGWLLAAPGTGLASGTCAIEPEQKAFARPSPIPFKGLTSSRMNLALDFSLIGEATYHDAFKPFDGASGFYWDRAAHTDFEKDGNGLENVLNSGLKWDLFEGRSATGEHVRVVAFAGTDLDIGKTVMSLLNNISIVSGPRSPARMNELKSIGVQDLLTDATQLVALTGQYWEALQIARQVIDATAREPGVKLYFTGHSLGGGLAQFVALLSKMEAIVFNSAGLGMSGAFIEHVVPKEHRTAANQNIMNIRMKGDRLSTGDWVHMVGLQLGQPVELTPPPGVWGGPLTLHGQKAMITAIRHEWEEAKISTGTMFKGPSIQSVRRPIGGVSIDPEMSFAPANLSRKREQLLKGMKE